MKARHQTGLLAAQVLQQRVKPKGAGQSTNVGRRVFPEVRVLLDEVGQEVEIGGLIRKSQRLRPIEWGLVHSFVIGEQAFKPDQRLELGRRISVPVLQGRFRARGRVPAHQRTSEVLQR